jgi:hypothetical protein
VIDFALMKDFKVKVVELNHFVTFFHSYSHSQDKTTGTGLFEKHDYLELGIFQKGPFEFRINERIIENSEDNVYLPLRNIYRKIKG